ncbi:MAG TPA: preprotein translocase subunit SecY [Pirellulales bacterium]|jgi:preprotein translocase subunit SecY|nr:preprotein translocase subunit SecY [Pirellulales bacterium]
MWEKLRIVFTIPELRRKIFLTLGLLAIYRVGFWIPLPIIDQSSTKNLFGDSGGFGDILKSVATFSASRLDEATIFGLGIMPYISASIIFQLLASVWKPLEELQKEGESGRKKINEYTRYATVVLCLFQSWFYIRFLESSGMIDQAFMENGALPISWTIVSVMVMTGGTIFLMWLGEQIDEFGIGNGISLLIMAGILARMPKAGIDLLRPIFRGELQLEAAPGEMGVAKLIVLAALFVAVVFGVVFITQGQRRIPMQSAKHVRGRRVYGGGTRQYLPLRVNQAGVMPIIFASSLLMFPGVGFDLLAKAFPSGGLGTFFSECRSALMTPWAYTHNVLYVVLIYFFCYFWTAITFNPKDMSENLKNFGSFIPGYRPGKRTADYLEKVMVRITYVGAGFLAVVAIMPTLVSQSAEIEYNLASFYGGTGLLIAVSVAFDLVQKIDSHLVMRNYKGLLE